MKNETLKVAREVISMLAIAVGFGDREEYQEAITLAEKYDLQNKWDDVPTKYKTEFYSLLDDWNG